MYHIAESEFKTLSKEYVKCEAKKGVNGILWTFTRFFEPYRKRWSKIYIFTQGWNTWPCLI